MSASRLASGGTEIDRSQPLSFTFDGQVVNAYAGDTIASALLAGDVAIVGRSFKYHRPRGIWGAGVEEPNALIDVSLDGRHLPNVRATTEAARARLVARSVNTSPTALASRSRIGAASSVSTPRMPIGSSRTSVRSTRSSRGS